jgi:hypothetical protein
MRISRLFLVGAGLLIVLALTLAPSTDAATEPVSYDCLICGTRGTADAILNILLFTPFGAGLSLLFSSTVAVLGSALLSVGVEVAQIGLVGRHATLGDVVFNTLGGGCGAFLVYLARALPGAVRHPSPIRSISAVLAPLGVFFVTPALVSPRFPETEYYAQWKHELGHLIPYPGEVLSASVGDVPLPEGLSSESGAIKEALEGGKPIRVSFVVAAPTPMEAHLLAIFDGAQTEVFLITVLERDLRFQWRSGSTALLLHEPLLQWGDAVPNTPGDTAEVELWQEGKTLCLKVNSLPSCALAGGIEQSWRLLYRASNAPPWLLTLLSSVWVIFLCIPAGVLVPAPVSKSALLGAGLGGFAVAASWWSPFMSPHWVTFLAPLIGVLAGAIIRLRLLKREAFTVSNADPVLGG